MKRRHFVYATYPALTPLSPQPGAGKITRALQDVLDGMRA